VPRTLGVEEEFHLVDLTSRRLAARAPELPPHLSKHFVAEMQSCVVEMNSAVVDDLAALRAGLHKHRRELISAATGSGLGAVAAGAVPLMARASSKALWRKLLATAQRLFPKPSERTETAVERYLTSISW